MAGPMRQGEGSPRIAAHLTCLCLFVSPLWPHGSRMDVGVTGVVSARVAGRSFIIDFDHQRRETLSSMEIRIEADSRRA